MIPGTLCIISLPDCRSCTLIMSFESSNKCIFLIVVEDRRMFWSKSVVILLGEAGATLQFLCGFVAILAPEAVSIRLS